MQSLYSLRSSTKPLRVDSVPLPPDRPRSSQPPLRPSVSAFPSPLPAFSIPSKPLPLPIAPPISVAHPFNGSASGHICDTSTQNYSSSGSNHEPSSVCLAAMVHEFLEEEGRVGSCGRARCNCLDGACGGEGNSDPAETDEPANDEGELFCEILEGISSCTSSSELLLLADVANALDAEAEETSNGSYNEAGLKATVGGLRRSVMKCLRQAGYNAGLCKSRWNHANGLPAGDYEYIDVLLATKDSKYDRYIVEIDFKAQFEIARASKQYFELLNVIPRLFVGRPERLKQILKVMSGAAKQSLKKQGLLLPPWRKLQYLQAKWFSSYRRTTNEESRKPPSSEESIRFIALRGPRLNLAFIKEMDVLHYRKQFVGLEPDPILKNCDAFCKEREVFRATNHAAECFVKEEREIFGKQRDICTVTCTDWQPPAINAKTESQRHRVSGLADALKGASNIYHAHGAKAT